MSPESTTDSQSGSRIFEWLFGPSSLSNIFGWAVVIFAAIVLRWAVIEPYKTPTHSMEPTIHGEPSYFAGDRVFVNKYVYGLRVPFMNRYIFRNQNPDRWDIVVFNTVDDSLGYGKMVKRIVGLPGEHIRIGDEGEVYINGERLDIPPGLKETFHYTKGIATSEDAAKARLIEIAKHPDGIDAVYGLMKWDDVSYGAIVESALTGQIPPQLNPEHKSSKRYMEEISALGESLRAKGITTVDQAREAGVYNDISDVSLMVMKDLLIFIEAPQYGLEPNPRSIVFDQSAIEQLNADAQMIADRLALENRTELLADVSDRSIELIQELMDMQAQARMPFRFALSDDEAFCRIPPDHYAMLGDNSGDSVDSRYYGWVPRENILGEVYAIWWPPSRWQDFTGWYGTARGKVYLFGSVIGLPIAVVLGAFWRRRRKNAAKQ